MTVKLSANGADALFGVMLDIPGADDGDGRDFAVGRPYARVVTHAAPTAPTKNLGGDPGLMTGTLRYAICQHVLAADGARVMSAWTAEQACTLNSVNLSDIPADAAVQFTSVYRQHQLEDGSWSPAYIIGRLYAGETVYTDNLVTDSLLIRYDQPPPAASEVGANHGLLFEGADSVDWSPQHGRIQSSELSSGEGETSSTPGPVKVTLKLKQAMRSAWEVPTSMSLLGLCTVKGVEGGVEKLTPTTAFDEPTRIYEFDSALARFDPRSFSPMFYPGGSIRPEWGLGIQGTDLEVAIDEGKLVTDTYSGMGIGYTTMSVGIHTAGTGTYHETKLPMLYGLFDDSWRALDDVYVSVTTAPTAGTFKIKVKIGSVATYSGSEITCYYNTGTDKRMMKGPLLLDRVELYDESGYAIGFDSGEVRLPLSIWFPGDVTTLAVGDIFKFLKEELIPGVGDSGARFSGEPVVRFNTPRYTQAHAVLKKSGALITAISAKLKLTAAHDDFTSLGKDAMFSEDIELSGKLKGELEIKRRYNDKSWQNALRRNDYFPVVVQCEGERIWVSPGVRSTYRRLWRMTLNECEVLDTNEATGNDKVTIQTVKLRARQPIDGTTSFCNLRLVTDKLWSIPA